MKKIVSIVCLVWLSFWQSFAFTDIQYNWYKSSIENLEQKWIINGFDDGKFLPNGNSTRAEVLKIILNAAEIDVADNSEYCFTDVAPSQWYAKYICSAKNIWVSKWFEDKTFKPNDEITVLETLAFAVRAFGIDLEYLWEGDTWYQKYQAFADQKKIIPKHAYTIDTIINRARAVDIMSRLIELKQWQLPDYLSAGCDMMSDIQSWEYTIEIWDSLRKYLLYVPNNTSVTKPLWLIVAFHGRTNSNEMVRDYMKLWGSTYVGSKDQQDFIVAYPAGMWVGPYSWSQYENVELFDAIVSTISENLCIQRDKVFSVGHSLWSYMSNKIACQRGGVLRAMVWVASSWYDSQCSGPAASLILHLPNDHLSAYSSGKYAYALRAEKNYCSPEANSIEIWDLKNCEQRSSCSLWNTVIFCSSYTPYLNDPHSWPKNGSDDIVNFLRNIEAFTK